MLYGKILYHSNVGYLTLISDDYYIRKLEFGKKELSKWNAVEESHQLLQEASKQLEEYLSGSRMQFDLPLAPEGTEFQKSVWNALLQIPYGQVSTYGKLAEQISKPKAARAVGGACHNNPIAIIIPCHRAVGANGNLTGFGGGLPLKRWLLDLESTNL